MRVHVVAACGVASLATYLKLEPWRWSLLLTCSFAVMVGELFNTSIEHLAKAVTREYHPEIKRALDVAAAAVLLASLGAVLVGLFVLYGPLLAWFAHEHGSE